MNQETNLNNILQKATREHFALGHFNIATLEMLQGIVTAAKNAKVPVMIGLSDGERKHIGLERAVCLVKTYEKELGFQLFLNADHSKSVESAFAAADAGFNSIHIDASEHSYEKNIEMTRAVVTHAKKISADISVEGELGFVPGESKISDTELSVDASLYTNPDMTADFVQKTGIDRLAIFVGNVHGLHKAEPKLDIDRIRLIRKNIPENVVLVLHAGSGIPDADITAAIAAGIANIHISTELRVGFANAIKSELQKIPIETTPYKFLHPAVSKVAEIVERKLIVFSGGKTV